MAATPLPEHTPTSAEVDAHLVEKIAQDGTLVVHDAVSGQLTTMKIAVLDVGGQLTIVAVGPGSG
jgi:hypothetical protein